MIQFDAVHKRFPNDTTAVHDLSLEMTEGGVTVRVGSSGCGKTTTLRMVNRMVEPTSGTIRVGGRDVTRQDAAELLETVGLAVDAGKRYPHRLSGGRQLGVPPGPQGTGGAWAWPAPRRVRQAARTRPING
ncbi:hypothetical protein GCM10010276_43850 [Streptomyces longisporus]|uniref:ABC transporter domain-containing protein n=1 Tax=Streptomyces longisporus TaxID=1948 RepID=A0ABP5ZHZ8_STRLO